jgi:hypothetical protein
LGNPSITGSQAKQQIAELLRDSVRLSRCLEPAARLLLFATSNRLADAFRGSQVCGLFGLHFDARIRSWDGGADRRPKGGGHLPHADRHEIEERIILVNERVLTTSVNDIEHIESQSLDGVSVIRYSDLFLSWRQNRGRRCPGDSHQSGGASSNCCLFGVI